MATDSRTKLGIVVFTLIEVGAVSALLLGFAWQVVAAIVAIAFMAEHVVSYNVKHGRSLFRLRGLPDADILVVTFLEALVWAVWFSLATAHPVVAGAVLFGGLLVGHVLERNMVAGLPLLRDPIQRIRESLDFTTLETAAGIAWLLLVPVDGLLAAVVLAVGLYVEHAISFRRPVEGGTR